MSDLLPTTPESQPTPFDLVVVNAIGTVNDRMGVLNRFGSRWAFSAYSESYLKGLRERQEFFKQIIGVEGAVRDRIGPRVAKSAIQVVAFEAWRDVTARARDGLLLPNLLIGLVLT